MAMKFLGKKLPKLSDKLLPIGAILIVIIIFFYPVFLKKLVPIPGDFIVGTYYPWLDYKWGYDVGVPVKNPVTSDVVSIIYPLRSYAVDVLRSGKLPLWNPFMFAGNPLLADFQVGIFSPTIIFYLFLPKMAAWTAQIMAQPFLAAVFCYLLLKHLGLSKTASFFGGLFYAFSGFNIIWMEWNTNTLTAAFIPLLILFTDKFFISKKIIWGVLLSLGLCLQIFSGYPQIVIFTLLALVGFIFINRWGEIKPKLIHILLFLFLGILLSSAIALPASELILNSQRKFEVLNADLIYLPWSHLITFFAPDYFGNPATYNYFGAGNYAINSGYSGIIVFCLAIIGVLKYRKIRYVKYFIWTLLLAVTLALPTPLAKAFYNSPIPGISASSNTRFLILANFSLAVLSAFGVHAMLGKNRIRLSVISLVPLLILLAVGVLTFFMGSNPDVSLRNMVLPVGFSGLAAALILLREGILKNQLARTLLVFIIAIAALLELFRYGWKYTPFSPPELVFPKTPALEYFENEPKPYRISTGNVIPMNMWVPYGLESLSGYDAVYPGSWAAFFNVTGGQDPANPSYKYYTDFDRYNSPWFDLLNNKYLMVLKSDRYEKNLLFDQVSETDKFEMVFQDKSVFIFRNNNVSPRAFFVTDWEIKADNEILTEISDSHFPSKNKILINRDPGFGKSDINSARASYVLYSPEKSVIKVETDKDGMLFLSEQWYPGWVATVDGVSTEIFRANYAFRAIPVKSGTRTVEITFKPKSFEVGVLLSVSAMVFLAGLLLYKKTL